MEIILFNGKNKMPKSDTPIIAVLLGKEGEQYSINSDYINAITRSGATPVLIEYENLYKNLEALKPNGVLLIGGTFPCPKSWYSQEVDCSNEIIPRCQAYIEMIKFAEEKKLPTLGICAGMQLLAIYKGAKMSFLPNSEKHKSKSLDVHEITIKENSLLHSIYKKNNSIVNSRHIEALSVIDNNEIIISAEDKDDNTIEAIELRNPWNEFVLGVQWHPETLFQEKNDLAAKNIFKKFVTAAINYKKAPK